MGKWVHKWGVRGKEGEQRWGGGGCQELKREGGGGGARAKKRIKRKEELGRGKILGKSLETQGAVNIGGEEWGMQSPNPPGNSLDVRGGLNCKGTRGLLTPGNPRLRYRGRPKVCQKRPRLVNPQDLGMAVCILRGAKATLSSSSTT